MTALTGLLGFLTFQLIVNAGCKTASTDKNAKTLEIAQTEDGQIAVTLSTVQKLDNGLRINVIRNECVIDSCTNTSHTSVSYLDYSNEAYCYPANGYDRDKATRIAAEPEIGTYYFGNNQTLRQGDKVDVTYVCTEVTTTLNGTIRYNQYYRKNLTLIYTVEVAKPQAPSNLLANPNSQDIDLTWQDNSDNESLFRIERAEQGMTNFVSIGQVSADITTYTDTTMTPDVIYDYRVFAQNSSGDSLPSDLSTAVLSSPGPPGTLNTFAVGPQVNLTWVDSSDETEFVIERSLTSGSGFTQIGTAAADTTTYFDTSVAGATTYYYRVKAVRGTISSAYSNESSVTSN